MRLVILTFLLCLGWSTLMSFDPSAGPSAKVDLSEISLSHWPSVVRYYHMTTSDTQGYAWFRVAKVGTRTILAVLGKYTQFSINGDFIPYTKQAFANHFKFAFVRNPWDRILSAYLSQVYPGRLAYYRECWGKDFETFINFLDRRDVSQTDRHTKLQTTLFPVHEVDFIGRFENFEHDFRYVLNRIGVGDVKIPVRNKTQHEHYSHYYTDRTREIIGRKYKADIEAFGYSFEYRD